MKELETKRLILRNLKKSDYKDMFEYAKKDNIGPNAGWSPHKDKKTTKTILKQMILSDDVLAICIKPSNKMVGTIGLHKRNNGYEIGYVLDDIYWGNGYMTEAVKRMIDYAFNELEINRLYCNHYDFNLRSKRVIEKCNFKYYSTELKFDRNNVLQNVLMYYLDKGDYKHE